MSKQKKPSTRPMEKNPAVAARATYDNYAKRGFFKTRKVNLSDF
jgi:hypothetical protein